MLNEKMIAKLESKGFKRWTKGNMDRLYINATALGLECVYYKTGNVRDASFQGSSISNSRARGFLAAKTYIDIATGTVHSDIQDLADAATALMDEAAEEIAKEEAPAQTAEEAASFDFTDINAICDQLNAAAKAAEEAAPTTTEVNKKEDKTMKPTKKSIAQQLPRLDALRREYRTHDQYGICPNRTFGSAYADLAEDGSIAIYAVGDGREPRHYYAGSYDDVVDITAQIEAAIKAEDYDVYGRDPKAYRAAVIDSIQDAIVAATSQPVK